MRLKMVVYEIKKLSTFSKQPSLVLISICIIEIVIEVRVRKGRKNNEKRPGLSHKKHSSFVTIEVGTRKCLQGR